jgi:hypothetical protein
MSDGIRVNGNQYSWGSIILKIGGDRFYGFSEIGFADKRERAKAYGLGRHQAPRGRSRGKYTTDPVKLKGSRGSVQEVREALAALATDGVSYGDVEFDVVVQYVESSDSSETPMIVEIERCVWASNSTSDTEGSDTLNDDIELDCMLIRRNGLTLFDSSEGSP